MQFEGVGLLGKPQRCVAFWAPYLIQFGISRIIASGIQVFENEEHDEVNKGLRRMILHPAVACCVVTPGGKPKAEREEIILYLEEWVLGNCPRSSVMHDAWTF
jgi:hypothetical protein